MQEELLAPCSLQHRARGPQGRELSEILTTPTQTPLCRVEEAPLSGWVDFESPLTPELVPYHMQRTC